jgi:hypothetical protein
LTYDVDTAHSGIRIDKICLLADTILLSSPDDRKQNISQMATYIHNWIYSQQNYKHNICANLRHSLSKRIDLWRWHNTKTLWIYSILLEMYHHVFLYKNNICLTFYDVNWHIYCVCNFVVNRSSYVYKLPFEIYSNHLGFHELLCATSWFGN